MIIRDAQTLALVDCCTCPPALCETPRLSCQSLYSTLVSKGFHNPTDTTWTVYKINKLGQTISASYTSLSGDEEDSTNAFEWNQDEWSQNYEGGVYGCNFSSASSIHTCDSGGSKTLKYYDASVEPKELLTSFATTRSSLAGVETEEHAQWLEDHPDYEAEKAQYEIDHAQWVEDMAQYNEDLEAYNDAYDAWAIAWNEWNDNGQEGEEPVFDMESPDEPVEPTLEEEPEEFYPDCYYRDTTVTTFYGEDPPDPITSHVDGASLGTTFWTYDGTNTGGFTDEYLDGVGYSSWVSSAHGEAITLMDFDNPDLTPCFDDQCKSRFSVTADPLSGSSNITLNSQRYRYCYGVPSEFSSLSATRSTYIVQWDEVFISKEWSDWKVLKDEYDAAVLAYEEWEDCEGEDCGDAPEIPPNPGEGPARPSLVSEREFIWGGSMEAPFSSWYIVEPPTIPGEVVLANGQILCYKDSKRGVVPTSFGTIIELEE